MSAIDELAKWLGITSVQAADLVGYKRSYYNWLKGTQPYPATTLNLFEAHAFVKALVDAIDERGSREWLQQDDAGRKRLELLRSQEGRDHLRRLSNDLLFPKREEVRWTPDFDFEHDPGDLRVGPESLFGEPLEVEEPLSASSEIEGTLSASSVVEKYTQPVIILGPRNVGKTSLIMQWHAPWDHRGSQPTYKHETTTVPVYDFEQVHLKRHFADPEIFTKVESHLELRIHDFPGEALAQESVIVQAKRESQSLRAQKENLGIVLICMFDANEAAAGEGRGLTRHAISYYGELFVKLQGTVSRRDIDIQRIILVFNKYDLLRKACPDGDDAGLLKRCISTFEPILTPLHGICNPEKVCEVFSVLDREKMVQNNRGAPIILGEAARGLVEAKMGSSAVRKNIAVEATRFSARNFPAH